jgi:hypothetical protein
VESFARGQRRDGTPMIAVNVRCLPLTAVDGKSF